MEPKSLAKHTGWLVAGCLITLFQVVPALAVTYNLTADEIAITMPDGKTITMWGFGLNGEEITVPGPMLEVTAGDSLAIELTNNLAEPISVVIPGQIAALHPVTYTDNETRTRVKSFTDELPANSTMTYTWDNLKAGTYIYHSGSHPALQVHMGLYGGIKVNAAEGESYPGMEYDSNVTLFYSEIDPALHDPEPKAAQPTNYKPAYFLVNGKPYHELDLPVPAGAAGQKVLLRFLNAGLKTHVPTFLNTYLDLIAEDGNLYPYPRKQYSVFLPAMKTIDAVWTPDLEGDYPVFDATHHLTTSGMGEGGMVTHLQVTAAADLVARDDNILVAEGGTVSTLDEGSESVLANDSGTRMTAVLVDDVWNGDLTLEANGTFTYSHDGSETTSDRFTYRISDGNVESNLATVEISVSPVNDVPVALDDSYEVFEEDNLTIAAPGVLANDTDPDGDNLTAGLVNGPAGTLNLNTDGSFDYTPVNGTGTDTFTYNVSDGTTTSANATVSISVIPQINNPPVAEDDYAETTRNVPVFVNLITNDSDQDGNLKDDLGNVAANRLTIVTPPTRDGTVEKVTNGVNFTPRKNFHGTDVFTYTVEDLGGADSNEATVRVNVLK